MTTRLAAIVAAALLSATPALAQDPMVGSWTDKGTGPAQFAWGGYATDGTYLYAFGGGGDSALQSRRLLRWDPATNTWTTDLAGFPFQVHSNCGEFHDGFLYSFGSLQYPPLPGGAGTSTPLDPILKYDIANNRWTELPVKLSPHGKDARAARAGSKIYVTGGFIQDLTYVIDGRRYSNALSEFDPATDTLTPRAPIPLPGVSMHASAAVNGKLYVFGGRHYDYSTSTGTLFASTYEYDPATDAWTQKANINILGVDQTRWGASAFAHNERIYLVGGRTTDSSGTSVVTNTCLEYDPFTDTWTQMLPMNHARWLHASGTIGGKGYVFGGSGLGTDPTVNTSIEEFTPPPHPPRVGGTTNPGGGDSDSGGSGCSVSPAPAASWPGLIVIATLLAALAAFRRQ